MGLKLVTAVTTEPVSLSEAKEYLRLDSTTFEDNLTIVNSIAGGYHVSATLTGTSTSILGNRSIVLVEPFLIVQVVQLIFRFMNQMII